MSNRHELHAFNYVNRPYQEVRTDLVDVLTRASGTDATVELHAIPGPVDLAAEILIELLAVRESHDNPRRSSTQASTEH